MRYRIFDMDKIREHNFLKKLNELEFQAILTEEESLAKFKEIWDAGYETRARNLSVFSDSFGIQSKSNTTQEVADWNNLKSKL